MKSHPASSPSSTPSARKATATALRPAARIGEKSRRGFAAMDPEQHRAIAKKAGKASADSGRAHKWSPEEAREAGRKGGEISRRKPKPKAEGK